MWVTKEIKLGTIPLKEKKILIFQRENDDREIVDLTPSCGCTKPEFNEKYNQILVFYTPNPFPKHLKHKATYTTEKSILVTYESGETDKLIFTATVKK